MKQFSKNTCRLSYTNVRIISCRKAFLNNKNVLNEIKPIVANMKRSKSSQEEEFDGIYYLIDVINPVMREILMDNTIDDFDAYLNNMKCCFEFFKNLYCMATLNTLKH
eukprot:gene337-6751_t